MKKKYVNDIVRKAVKFVGYLEKKTPTELYSMTGNAGKNNYTRFAVDIGVKNGQYWCATFIMAIFMYVYSDSAWVDMLYGKTLSCSELAEQFSKKNKFKKEPKVGSLVLFKEKNQKHKLDMAHVGIVVGIDDKYIYTVEGNTSSDAGVVANGGSVNNKRYLKTEPRIGGYCIVEYDKCDVPALPTKTVKFGSTGSQVMRLQALLNVLGIGDSSGNKLVVDGKCGSKTEYAIKRFQDIYFLSIDGSFGPNCRAKAKEIIKYV